MPRINIMLTFQSLYESSVVSVSDYLCRACRGGPMDEEYCTDNTIVLMRHGVFCKHVGKQVSTSDVNQATFFSSGSTYRVSHPADCGDRGTVFSVTPHILNDIVREFDPSIDDHPERPFPFLSGPCDSYTYSQHRTLVAAVESTPPSRTDSMAVDEHAMQLVAAVISAGFQRTELLKKHRRRRTEASHAELVDAAKSYVACRLGDRVTLDDVATAVDASPFHLARVFRERTGMPIHRYLVCLRLRTALEHLAAGASNLSTLALELGFSSHGHFSERFRREFGCSPSDLRDSLTRRLLREMSKNLEA